MSALDELLQLADRNYGIDDRIRPCDLIMKAQDELKELRSHIASLEDTLAQADKLISVLAPDKDCDCAKTEWQDIETCPNNIEDEFLVFVPNMGIKFVAKGEPVYFTATHWMPLPEPPEELK